MCLKEPPRLANREQVGQNRVDAIGLSQNPAMGIQINDFEDIGIGFENRRDSLGLRHKVIPPPGGRQGQRALGALDHGAH